MAAAWSAFWPSGPGLWGPPLGNWVLPASLPERTSHSAWPTRKWEAHEFQKDCSRPLRKLMGKQDCSHLSLAGWFQKHQTTGLWLYNKNNSCDCSLSFFWMNIFSMLSPVLVFMCITFFNLRSSQAWERGSNIFCFLVCPAIFYFLLFFASFLFFMCTQWPWSCFSIYNIQL